MATVSNQLTRIHDAEGSLTTVNIPSGGGGAAANTDIFLQAAQSLGKRLIITATTEGFALVDAADNDCSAASVHVGVWLWVTHYGILDDLRILFGTGTGSTIFDAHTFPLAEFPKLGGWVRAWVDVSRTPDFTGGGGGLTESQLREYGVQVSFSSAPGGNAANVIIDAADFTDGTAALDLTGTSGLWSDFTTADENTTNQYGVFRTVGGVYNCFARVQLGQSGASLVFNDSGFTIIFPRQQLVESTFMGITVDLQHASTNIDWASGVIKSAYPAGNRGDLVVVGTSGDFDASAMTLADLRTITLTSAASIIDSLFVGCGQIALAGGTINGSTVQGYEGAADSAAAVWNDTADPNGNIDNTTWIKGTAATHAIEFGTSSPTTMTLTGITFSGYNASDGQNDSALYFARTSGSVTVNISGGAVPSYKSAGATINFVSSINVTLTGLVNGSEVRVYDSGDDSLIDGTESVTGNEFTFSSGAGNTVYIRIFHVNYLPADIVGYVVPGTDTDVPVQQIFDRNYENP